MTTVVSVLKPRRLDVEPDVRYVNRAGAWAELRFDPNVNHKPGLGCLGVWYVVVWSPDLPGNAGPYDLAMSPHRGQAERVIRAWLANRPLAD